jgi:hypothetical protein
MKRSVFFKFILYFSIVVFGETFAIPITPSTISLSTNKKEPSISVYLEQFNETEVDFNSSKKQFLSGNEEIIFLNNYYTLGVLGNRAELLKLYEPSLQVQIRKKFLTNTSLKNEFAELRSVKLIKTLYWGGYRFILVEHKSSLDSERHTWIHAVKCVNGACLFYEKPELVQVVSFIYYQQRKNLTEQKKSFVRDTTQLQIFSENETNLLVRKIDKFPISFNFHDVDSNVATQVKKLFQTLLKLASNDQGGAADASNLFDNKLPKAYPLRSAKGELNVFGYEAFIRTLKNQSEWKVNRIYYGQNDTVLLNAVASNGMQIILPVILVEGQYRIMTDFQRNNSWPIFETVQFFAAWNNLVGIK